MTLSLLLLSFLDDEKRRPVGCCRWIKLVTFPSRRRPPPPPACNSVTRDPSQHRQRSLEPMRISS
uniref:Uncharacterized protein n=1 Tax=Utricularia reniformis TaxID=192314 RepID=A0A1Y0B0K8_9LAMI|nr:hypothetical protein AEK19_MT0656 [Utricularia reniformis]ART30908.1 hypothetical protein AEK19_MT0656 [Utricularia reniformis]